MTEPEPDAKPVNTARLRRGLDDAMETVRRSIRFGGALLSVANLFAKVTESLLDVLDQHDERIKALEVPAALDTRMLTTMRRAEEAVLDGEPVVFIAVTLGDDGQPYSGALDPNRVSLHADSGPRNDEIASRIAAASDRWSTRGGPW